MAIKELIKFKYNQLKYCSKLIQLVFYVFIVYYVRDEYAQSLNIKYKSEINP